MMPSQRSAARLGPYILGSMLAFSISAAALVAAASVHDQPADVSISPFGWNRLVVIHALSTLIVSWWLAGRIWQQLSVIRPVRMLIGWGFVGLMLAALTWLGGAFVRPVVDVVNAGFVVRLMVRVMWCMTLQVPWCFVGLAIREDADTRLTIKSAALNLLCLGVVAALGVPISFLAVFCEEQTRVASDHWLRGQLVDAQRRVQRLYDVGSTTSLGERAAELPVSPRRALADLQMAIQYVGHRVDQSGRGQLDDRGRLQLARDYLTLGSTAGARQILLPMGDRDPIAAILLAEIYQREGNVRAGRDWAERALTVAQAMINHRPDAAAAMEDIQLRAYDMLAVFAGEAGDFKAAEECFLEALAALPQRAAEIHDRLGKHYEFLGELPRAIQHQQQAALLDPEMFVPPETLTQKVLSSGAPVGLARPKSSRYK